VTRNPKAARLGERKRCSESVEPTNRNLI